MNWRNQLITISRGRLIGGMIAGGFLVATLSLILSAVLIAALAEPLDIMVVAIVAAFTARFVVSLWETASFYLRRRARRRRMRAGIPRT